MTVELESYRSKALPVLCDAPLDTPGDGKCTPLSNRLPD
jgi:hypothetical protein